MFPGLLPGLLPELIVGFMGFRVASWVAPGMFHELFYGLFPG